MGQYYKVINVDKKEFIHPHKFGCGLKLMEWCYIDDKGESNAFVSAMVYLLNNRWKGDRVYVVGDYADSESATGDIDMINTIAKMFAGNGIHLTTSVPVDTNRDCVKTVAIDNDWQNVLKALERELEWIGKKDEDGYNMSLYRCDENGFTELEPKDIGPEFVDVSTDWSADNTTGVVAPRYLCNSIAKEYIDLRALPLEWSDDTVSVSVFPLGLLLAMGNGLGGGDYYGTNTELVGTWTPYSSGIHFEDEIPQGYDSFGFDFTERS